MSERKVINKYFPPEFDPSKIPFGSSGVAPKRTVRLMTPFSMRCNTCGEYIYKRKKFNARKETVWEENYLGIRIFRFYIKCPRCSSEISFKTDPKNTDYVCEQGAQRNFEPWREQEIISEQLHNERMQEEEANPMKALENKTFDSKREMEILDMLDEIRTVNARVERVDPDQVLKKMIEENQSSRDEAIRKQQEEDDLLAKSIFQSADGESVKRLVFDDPKELEEQQDIASYGSLSDSRKNQMSFSKLDQNVVSQTKRKLADDLGIIVKKKTATSTPSTEAQVAASTQKSNSLIAYSDSEEDE